MHHHREVNNSALPLLISTTRYFCRWCIFLLWKAVLWCQIAMLTLANVNLPMYPRKGMCFYRQLIHTFFNIMDGYIIYVLQLLFHYSSSCQMWFRLTISLDFMGLLESNNSNMIFNFVFIFLLFDYSFPHISPITLPCLTDPHLPH